MFGYRRGSPAASDQSHTLVTSSVAPTVLQVRLACVPDGPCLHSLVQFLYLDDVQQQAGLTPQLHVAAIACGLQRLVRLCEARFAQQLEVQLFSWPGKGKAAALDACTHKRIGCILDGLVTA